MELRDAILGRRSTRKYLDKDVSDTQLIELIENACWAPSATNRQPWFFTVVRTPDKKAELLNIMHLIRSHGDLITLPARNIKTLYSISS